MVGEPFQGSILFNVLIPGLSLALQPWAKISQRLRRFFKLNYY